MRTSTATRATSRRLTWLLSLVLVWAVVDSALAENLFAPPVGQRSQFACQGQYGKSYEYVVDSVDAGIIRYNALEDGQPATILKPLSFLGTTLNVETKSKKYGHRRMTDGLEQFEELGALSLGSRFTGFVRQLASDGAHNWNYTVTVVDRRTISNDILGEVEIYVIEESRWVSNYESKMVQYLSPKHSEVIYWKYTDNNNSFEECHLIALDVPGWKPDQHAAIMTPLPPDTSLQPKQHAAISTPPAPDTALVRQRVALIQRGLASLGYDPGPADGVLGPRSRTAIRDFESREGLPVTGMISERLEAALRSASPEVASTTPPAPRPLKKAATGSGFIVSPQGHILTNEHVVSACREVRVAGTGIAALMATDEKIDLALLKVGSDERSAASFRGGRGVRTGEDIVVVGYPLQGLLSSEMNATKGTVSALAGPGDDQRIIQITAPVQPGNSGGPVLDASGNVVGVVVGKLDAIKLAMASGMLPENVNFAISEGAARAFLDGHDVPYETAPSIKPMPTADIAANAKGYTVLIECWR